MIIILTLTERFPSIWTTSRTMSHAGMLLRGQAINFYSEFPGMTLDLGLFCAMQLQVIIICSVSKKKKILTELFFKKQKM